MRLSDQWLGEAVNSLKGIDYERRDIENFLKVFAKTVGIHVSTKFRTDAERNDNTLTVSFRKPWALFPFHTDVIHLRPSSTDTGFFVESSDAPVIGLSAEFLSSSEDCVKKVIAGLSYKLEPRQLRLLKTEAAFTLV